MPSQKYNRTKSSLFSWNGPTAIALATMVPMAAIVLPAQATPVLEEWTFEPQSRQLSVTLPDGTTPQFFLLAEPARIVLDVPQTVLGNVPTEQHYDGAVRRIRLAEVQGNVQIVIELAPNTLLDPRHAQLQSIATEGALTQWVLQPLLQDIPAAEIARSQSSPPATPSPQPSASTTDVTTPAAAASPSTAAGSETPEPATAITATQPSGATSTPSSSDLPSPAMPATVGAAQALTGVSEALAGVRTDAAALAGVGTETSTDLSSAALPGDALGSRNLPSATSTVPSTAGPAGTPQVAVPDLASVPEIPASSPSSSAGVPAGLQGPPTESPASLQDGPPVTAVASPPPEPEIIPTTPPEVGAEPPEPTAEVDSIPLTDPVELSSSAPIASPPPAPAETAAAVAIAQAPPFQKTTGTAPEGAGQPSIPPPPAVSSRHGAVPFGAPLPLQTKALSSPETVSGDAAGAIPVGTRLVLQYPGTEPLTLEQQEPWHEVLVVAEDVLHPQTGERLVSAGTSVLGRFEGFDNSGRRFVTHVVIEGSDRSPILAESDWLLGSSRPNSGNILTNSGIGAVAVTVLSGFSGIGLLGGAVLGAASALATTPNLVSIQPGQLIEVEVVADILPFQESATPQPRL